MYLCFLLYWCIGAIYITQLSKYFKHFFICISAILFLISYFSTVLFHLLTPLILLISIHFFLPSLLILIVPIIYCKKWNISIMKSTYYYYPHVLFSISQFLPQSEATVGLFLDHSNSCECNKATKLCVRLVIHTLQVCD